MLPRCLSIALFPNRGCMVDRSRRLARKLPPLLDRMQPVFQQTGSIVVRLIRRLGTPALQRIPWRDLMPGFVIRWAARWRYSRVQTEEESYDVLMDDYYDDDDDELM